MAAGHVGVGLTGFLFATFAVCWAWINFTWFASAYDTDDWIYRVLTMVQMVGVLDPGAGHPAVLRLHRARRTPRQLGIGRRLRGDARRDGGAVAARRPAGSAPQSACLTYAGVITVVQIGWIAVIFLPVTVPVGLAVFVVLGLAEARAVAGRDPQGRHAVACAPHRRALRAAGHHRPR